MNKRGFFRIIMILVVIIIIGFFWFVNQKQDFGNGKTNADECPGEGCVKVQTTCCPCSMGGEEKCVKESEVENYTLALENCPETHLCAAVYNCKIESCNKTGVA